MRPISSYVRVRDTVPSEQTVADSPGPHPTRRPRSGWVPGECARRPIAGARSTLRRPLGLDDFAACLRALVGTAHVDEPLALARALALARVLRTRASPLALQALTPLQCTSPPALSAPRATTAPLSNRLAAALAINMPFRHPFVVPSFDLSASRAISRPPSPSGDQAIDAVATRA